MPGAMMHSTHTCSPFTACGTPMAAASAALLLASALASPLRTWLDTSQGNEVAALAGEYGDDAKVAVRLHPPLLRALGRKEKMAFGARTAPVLAGLAKMKKLRGTRLDPFGYTEIRRTERELVVERLQRAVGNGRLTVEEFEERAAAAYAATTRGELADLQPRLLEGGDGGRRGTWSRRRTATRCTPGRSASWLTAPGSSPSSATTRATPPERGPRPPFAQPAPIRYRNGLFVHLPFTLGSLP